MKAIVHNSNFLGNVKIPSSKSYTHRLLIAGALYNYIHNIPVRINNILECEDSLATINILKNMGFEIEIKDLIVDIRGYNKKNIVKFDCNASGSTARFFIPILSYFYDEYEINGISKLISRLQTSDLEDLIGLTFIFSDKINIKGSLTLKKYYLTQKNTTQFISGMVFSMILYNFKIQVDDLLNPYVLMTIDALKMFGFKFKVDEEPQGTTITYFGCEKIDNPVVEVEGDYSNASYFYNINFLNNNKVIIDNLNPNSIQGDKIYLDFLNEIFKNEICKLDIHNYPDLGPALFAVSCVSGRYVTITGIEKLYLKESNRVDSMVNNLRLMGATIEVNDNKVYIQGKHYLNGGVIVDSYNDHRIVMALASIASRVKEPYTILNVEAINKSYPEFFNDYIKLSGKVEIGE